MVALEIPGIAVVPCRLNGPGGIVKTCVLHDDDELVIVDTGAGVEDADAILTRIEVLGRRPAEVTACVLTHSHPDHLGGLERLLAATGARARSHALDASDIAEATGCEIDGDLADGDELAILGGVRVIHLPGHSPGSVALHVPRARTLVSGDALFSAGQWLVPPPDYLSSDPAAVRASVRRLVELDLDVERVVVGHGEDVPDGGAQRLRWLLAARRVF